MHHYSTTIKQINIADFDYHLPEEKIALYPLAQRNASKLLVYQNNTIIDSRFSDIFQFINSEHFLVFNDSKVIHARLLVKNHEGTNIEIFCLEPLFPVTELSSAFEQSGKVIWKCMVGNAKKWKNPVEITVPMLDKELIIKATKGENMEGTFAVTFEWNGDCSFAEWLENYGKVPLPPYIKRKSEEGDNERYQTVYAQHDGSVAAPTAGLHFSEHEFQELDKRNIAYCYATLHVGAGTFKPVSVSYIGEHFMHKEQMIITAKLLEKLLCMIDKKVIAVGTTATRTLESLFIMGAKLKLGLPDPFLVKQWEYYDNQSIREVSVEESLSHLLHFCHQSGKDYITGSTQLMILPGYQYKIVKGLLTNFHQPKSTLLLLISSFLGDRWKDIYQHALAHGYRFLSYGDVNLYL
jgi:S-adenosylmethionine:tRNA ribosyltransferase-isomerase